MRSAWRARRGKATLGIYKEQVARLIVDTAPDFKEVGSDQGLVAAVERFRYFLSFQTSPTKENPKGSLYFGADAAEYYLDVADKNDLAKTLVEDDLTKLKTFMWLLVATQRKRLDALSKAVSAKGVAKAPKRAQTSEKDEAATTEALAMFRKKAKKGR